MNAINQLHEWTVERIETLTQLWSEGHSCTEVARLMGGISRNAVIGKVRRLALPKRATVARKNPTPKPRPKAKRPAVEDAPEEPIVTEDGYIAFPTSLFDLKSHDCRWPHGDPKDDRFGFCGQPAVEGKPYCTAHCRRAYSGWQPAQKEGAA